MRKKIIAGNWKMNFTVSQAEDFITGIKDSINTQEVDVVICPNVTALDRVSDLLEGTHIMLGAQNVSTADSGAYTGETSIDMLIACGVSYCIVGHSERRQLFHETDEMINEKALKVLEKGLYPIICVGETLEQRNAHHMFDIIENQVNKALATIAKEEIANKVIIAYEPIWAIGTGVTASVEQAEEMCRFIRSVVSKLYDEVTADAVRIQYGGSVKPSNCDEILSAPNIDGALVGGCSLTNDFVAIVNYETK